MTLNESTAGKLEPCAHQQDREHDQATTDPECPKCPTVMATDRICHFLIMHFRRTALWTP